MKRILLIHTGGTLGMAGSKPRALKPASFFNLLKERIPELSGLASFEVELFSNIDSSEMQPEIWSALAKRLYTRLSSFDGAVVTHGTDTLAYTASALSFMLPGLKKPVVLTGAQRPLREVRSDARLNLIDAVTAALHGPKEVTVCFDSRLYRGNRVHKVSVSEYDAFDSPNFPPLGVLGVETRFERGLNARGAFKIKADIEPAVFLLKVFPGLDPDWVRTLLPKLKGLVVEAHGAGNFPVSKQHGRSLQGVFAEAQRLKIPVVVTSQAHRNGVDLSLYEAGQTALAHGAMSAADMTSTCALVKLMHGLGQFKNPAALRRYFNANSAGERG
jgi:L-asparaginase